MAQSLTPGKVKHVQIVTQIQIVVGMAIFPKGHREAQRSQGSSVTYSQIEASFQLLVGAPIIHIPDAEALNSQTGNDVALRLGGQPNIEGFIHRRADLIFLIAQISFRTSQIERIDIDLLLTKP